MFLKKLFYKLFVQEFNWSFCFHFLYNTTKEEQIDTNQELALPLRTKSQTAGERTRKNVKSDFSIE